MSNPDEPSQSQPLSNRRRSASVIVGVFAIVVIGLGIAGLYLVRSFGDQTPDLTPEGLRNALAQWERAAIHSYTVGIEVQGMKPETYEVQVVDGLALRVFRNGFELKEVRSSDAWSVPGMFDTIRADVARDEAVRNGKAGRNDTRATLRCKFDPTTGVPLVYRRIPWAVAPETSWRVTRFEPILASAETTLK